MLSATQASASAVEQPLDTPPSVSALTLMLTEVGTAAVSARLEVTPNPTVFHRPVCPDAAP
jgi:hypothetical protein